MTSRERQQQEENATATCKRWFDLQIHRTIAAIAERQGTDELCDAVDETQRVTGEDHPEGGYRLAGGHRP